VTTSVTVRLPDLRGFHAFHILIVHTFFNWISNNFMISAMPLVICGQHECWWQIVRQLDHDGDPEVSRIKLLEPRTLSAKFDCKTKRSVSGVSRSKQEYAGMNLTLLHWKPPACVLAMGDVLVRHNTWILCWQVEPGDGTRRARCGVSSSSCQNKLSLHCTQQGTYHSRLGRSGRGRSRTARIRKAE
jgi:hypothetical protein